MPFKGDQRCLEDYIRSLRVSRSTYPSKAGEPGALDVSNCSKGLRLTADSELNSLNRSAKAERIVEDIEIQRRKCPMLNDLCFDAKLVTRDFRLTAGSEVGVCRAGRRSFDTQYSLPIGEVMFLRFADVLICEEFADYFTLDEWARYVGRLLKPLVVSYKQASSADEYQIPMDEMPDVKKWMYLSFSLLKELAKNPWSTVFYDSEWSGSAFLNCNVTGGGDGPDQHIPKYKHPPGYKPVAVHQKRLADGGFQNLALVHPVYFLTPEEFKPKIPGDAGGTRRKKFIDNWGLPFSQFYEGVSHRDVFDDFRDDLIESQFVKLLKANKLKRLGEIKKTEPSFDVVLRVGLPSTTPPLWRRVRVNADLSLFDLAVLLEPIMGWRVRHFAYVYNDPNDGAVFGPTGYETDDSYLLEKFQGPVSARNGSGMIDDKEVYLGQLLRQVEDWIVWTHRLDHQWMHYVRVEQVVPWDRVKGKPDERCVLLDGSVSCPRYSYGGNKEFCVMMRELSTTAKKPGKEKKLFNRLVNFNLAKHRKDLARVMESGKSNELEETGEEDVSGATRKNQEPITTHEKVERQDEEKEESDGREARFNRAPDAMNGLPAGRPQFHHDGGEKSDCAACGSSGKMRLCTGCRDVGYCSVECQREDWKANHKNLCNWASKVKSSKEQRVEAASHDGSEKKSSDHRGDGVAAKSGADCKASGQAYSRAAKFMAANSNGNDETNTQASGTQTQASSTKKKAQASSAKVDNQASSAKANTQASCNKSSIPENAKKKKPRIVLQAGNSTANPVALEVARSPFGSDHVLTEMGEDPETHSKFEESVTDEMLDRAIAKIKAMIKSEKAAKARN